MFRHSAELARRGLLQRRSRWRAILPHAIANRLAAMAPQNIAPNTIENCFDCSGRERLLTSFSRRLGYLNGNREAESIVKKWFTINGLLSGLPDSDELGHTLFRNIAPVDPEETLRAFERVVRNPPDPEVVSRCNRYLPLLRSLAYDPTLFERCAALMVSIAEATNIKDDEDHEAVRIFTSLFPIYFSGTHAAIEQRLARLKNLLLSPDVKKRTLSLTESGQHLKPYISLPVGISTLERTRATLALGPAIGMILNIRFGNAAPGRGDCLLGPSGGTQGGRHIIPENSVAFGALRRCTTILSASSPARRKEFLECGLDAVAKPCIMTAVASLRRSLIGLHG